MCATWSVTLAFHGWSCASTFAIIQGLLQLVTLVPKKSSQPQAELEFQWQPPVSQIHKICPALPSIVLIMTQNLFHHQNGQSLSSKISMGSGRHIRQLIGSFHHHSTSFMSQTPSRNKPAPQSRDRDMKAVAKSDQAALETKENRHKEPLLGMRMCDCPLWLFWDPITVVVLLIWHQWTFITGSHPLSSLLVGPWVICYLWLRENGLLSSVSLVSVTMFIHQWD